MIETVYTDNTKKNDETVSIKLPKNIRQIGQSNSDYQIYVEDTVMNFLKKKLLKDGSIRYGILLGNVKYGYGYTYIFVNAAVEVEEIMENAIIFSDEVWEDLNQNVRKYFDDLRVVGWFSSLEYADAFDMSYAAKIHLYNFGGLDKIYLKIDRDEDDETFYTYSENGFVKQGGYHIYFDRNMRMEEYMAEEKMPYVIETDANKVSESNVKYTIYNESGKAKEKNTSYKIEKKNSDMASKAASISKKISSNVASVLLVAALVGTVAIVSNEKSMNKIKTYMNNLIYKEGNEKTSDEYRIPVNGMVNVNDVIEETATSSYVQADNKISENQTSNNIEETSSKSEINETTNSQVIEQTTSNVESTTVFTEPGTSGLQESGTTGLQEPNTSEIRETATVQRVVVDTSREYVVQKGDTLLIIASKMYGDKTKVKDIMQANNIENADYVEAGDKLYLP